MTYQPTSTILFLSICSLNKVHGGEPRYDKKEAIVSALSTHSESRFLNRREEVRQLVKRAKELDWQGVPLSELEFNLNLGRGQDFGGKHTAEYHPALHRYDGAFFQTLGPDGRRKLAQSRHHTLFLSGLYGLVRALEPIQLYSCPVKPEVANLWLKDNVLTEVLAEYIHKFRIVRVFDLTALVAYRNLIDWTSIVQSGTDVLHCFDTMSAGDPTLIPLARLMKNFMLDAPEETLIDLEPEKRIGSVVFRSVEVTRPELPSEMQLLYSAEREAPLLQSHPIELIPEVLRGGHPIVPTESLGSQRRQEREWLFAASSPFIKGCRQRKDMSDRVFRAILEIWRDPITPHGDTVKRLKGNNKGKWEYKVGDFRIIYEPDKDSRVVRLLTFGPKGDPELYD